MDFSLTEEQQALRDGIVRFAREVLNEGAAERDASRPSRASCGEVRRDRASRACRCPNEYGGSGLDR